MNPDTPTILIVIPDKVQCALAEMALRRQGWQAVSVDPVSQVRNFLNEYQPAMMLMELNLPEQNGLDLIHALREEGYLEETAIFIVSAMRFPEVVRQAAAEGICDFLARPLDVERLVERVRKKWLETTTPTRKGMSNV